MSDAEKIAKLQVRKARVANVSVSRWKVANTSISVEAKIATESCGPVEDR